MAMLSPVSPSATGNTLRSLTSERRLSSSASEDATTLRNRMRLSSGTRTLYTDAPAGFGSEVRAERLRLKRLW